MPESTLHLQRLDGHGLRKLKHMQPITIRAHGVQNIAARFIQVNGPGFDPRTFTVTVDVDGVRDVYSSLGNAFYIERPPKVRRAKAVLGKLHSMFEPYKFIFRGILIALAFVVAVVGLGLGALAIWVVTRG